jgi:hypothetical protein
MQLLLSMALCAMTLLLTTAFHFEVLRYLSSFTTPAMIIRRHRVPVILLVLVTAHIFEIIIYALVYALAAGPLALGNFSGVETMSPIDYFYFAAETYSTLGYGDIVPLGELRLIASIGPLNGILLMAWSGSFLFSVVQHSIVPRPNDAGR